MKKEYNIKDQVWIHLGDPKLTEGRIVEIIDLEHLGEGHSPDQELYIIEIKTGIDDVYEVRTWSQISNTKEGPINFFKEIKEDMNAAQKFLKKVGIVLPNGALNPVYYSEEVKKPKRRNYRNKKPL